MVPDHPRVSPSRPEEVFVDELFSVLASERRRLVVRYLRENDRDEVRVADLAKFVAEERHDRTDEKRVVSALHHIDLPKLEEVGIIERHGWSDTVRYRSQPLLEGCLRLVEELQVGS